MAINRKGSRRIGVNGETYLWRVRDNGDHTTVVIQHTDARHQYLTFGWIDSPAMLSGQLPPITPGIIRQSIDCALAAGWEPLSEEGKLVLVKIPYCQIGSI